jgi:hypothetical protein
MAAVPGPELLPASHQEINSELLKESTGRCCFALGTCFGWKYHNQPCRGMAELRFVAQQLPDSAVDLVAKAGLNLENCIEAGPSEDTQVNSLIPHHPTA